MQNTYLQIIFKGINMFLLKTFLIKIISLFFTFSPGQSLHNFLIFTYLWEYWTWVHQQRKFKVIYYFSETVEVCIGKGQGEVDEYKHILVVEWWILSHLRIYTEVKIVENGTS